MRDKCEASGLRVKPLENGLGHCPLCGDDWHALTSSFALVTHTRTHGETHARIQAVRDWKETAPAGDAGLWPGWPVSARG